jgi:predicted ester cyclase
MKNSNTAANFINQIWNNQEFEKLGEFLHPAFQDHSLPSAFPKNQDGLRKWITATSSSFEHKTIIEDQVTEGDKSIIKLSMELKHVGAWRGIEPTGMEVTTTGYRFFRFRDGKIIEHNALINGEAIETQLKQLAPACKVQQLVN